MWSAGQQSIIVSLGVGFDFAVAANVLLDLNTEAASQMLQPDKNLTNLDQLGVYLTAVSGTPPDCVLAVQEVNTTTGLPDGTDVALTANFTPAVGWQWVATTASFNWNDGVTRFIIIRNGTTQFDATHSVTVGGNSASAATNSLHRFPVRQTQAGAVDGNTNFLAARNSADNTHMVGPAVGSSTTVLSNVNSAATANHITAVKFVAPITGTPSSCRLSAQPTAQNATLRVGIYDATGTAVCETETLEEDYGLNWTNTSALRHNEFGFATQAEITRDTTYYLGMKNVSAAASRLNTIKFDANAHLNVLRGGTGTFASVWNGTTWTDTNTEVPEVAEIAFGSVSISGGARNPLRGPVGP